MTLILGILLVAGAISVFAVRQYKMLDLSPIALEPPTGLPEPVLPTTPPPAPKTPTVAEFCLAIRDFEGQPGDPNYRNNNPGNCRYSKAGYLPIYGPVGRSPNGFAIFKDYATGWLYLNNFVKSVIHNHPNLTIYTFIAGEGTWGGYSPASDNNPVLNYATFLGKRLGVDKDFPMKNLALS